jgi:hypothetical protein
MVSVTALRAFPRTHRLPLDERAVLALLIVYSFSTNF